MDQISRPLALAREAIEIVLRRLSALPPTPEVEELRARAQDCRQRVESWGHEAPTTEQREAVMKRVLGLHTEVARLERET